jgi:hypothetical protein
MGIADNIRDKAFSEFKKTQENLSTLQVEARKIARVMETYGYRGVRIFKGSAPMASPQMFVVKQQNGYIYGFYYNESPNFSLSNWFPDFVAGNMSFVKTIALKDLCISLDNVFEDDGTQLEIFSRWLNQYGSLEFEIIRNQNSGNENK